MIAIQLKDIYGSILFEDLIVSDKELSETCNSECEDFYCKVSKKKKRHGKIKSDLGQVYIVTNERNLVKNKKIFKRTLNGHLTLLRKYIDLSEKGAEFYKPLFEKVKHNVKTINAQNIQEIFSLVSQEELISDFNSQISTITSIVRNNSEETAKILFRLIKNNLLVKVEFQAFEALINPNRLVNRRKHVLRKIILNVAHTFFYDFRDRRIYFSIEDNDDKVLLHYPTIVAALVHILDNAKKYSKSDSKIMVSFEKRVENFIVKFSMISYKVYHDEISKLFDEGFSGKYSKTLNLAEAGMGMSIISKLIHLNGGKFLFKTNVNDLLKKTINGVEYENNQAILVFPLKSNLKMS